MQKRPRVDLDRKKSQILVVHCSDPRFQAAYRHVIDGLGSYYDLLVVPGASKAIVDKHSVVEKIKMLHELHHFETVHILDHTHCGAFGKIDNEFDVHQQMIRKAEEALADSLPDISVKGYLLDEKSELTSFKG